VSLTYDRSNNDPMIHGNVRALGRMIVAEQLQKKRKE